MVADMGSVGQGGLTQGVGASATPGPGTHITILVVIIIFLIMTMIIIFNIVIIIILSSVTSLPLCQGGTWNTYYYFGCHYYLRTI